MVIIWNDSGPGDRGRARRVELDLQAAAFAALWFYLSVLAGLAGPHHHRHIPVQIAKSVLIFLGIPLLAGYLSRRIGEKTAPTGMNPASCPR